MKDAIAEAIAGRHSVQLHAEYATELARQLVYDIFKDDAYTRGLNVYLTINSNDQKAAYNAVRANSIAFDRAHGYRGPDDAAREPRGSGKGCEGSAPQGDFEPEPASGCGAQHFTPDQGGFRLRKDHHARPRLELFRRRLPEVERS